MTGRNKGGGDYDPAALKGDGQSGRGKGRKKGAGGNEPGECLVSLVVHLVLTW
jgi:hypothetical protein